MGYRKSLTINKYLSKRNWLRHWQDFNIKKWPSVCQSSGLIFVGFSCFGEEHLRYMTFCPTD